LVPLLPRLVEPDMKALERLAVAVFLVVAATGVQAQGEAWPPLPKQGFIAGRTATRADVAAGRAVFSAESSGVAAGKPLKIAIPQYAYYKEGDKRTPVIVVQAEEAQGLMLVGVRLANGKSLILPLKSIQLLGKTPPGK
jgi:hypothetical protein